MYLLRQVPGIAGLQLACNRRFRLRIEEIRLIKHRGRYDGWETRRHNPSPPDHVTIRVGPAAGVVQGVEIDTAFFTGNYGEEVEVLGALETGPEADAEVTSPTYKDWFSLLGRRKCGPSQRHAWFVDKDAEGRQVTHVRLHMYPDGGIARFRLYGHAAPVWPAEPDAEVELSAATNGGVAIAASDEHFGRKSNLILPGRGKDMGDGWETKRSRGAGHIDWTIFKLGARGFVNRIVVDTMHFRGNFPRGVRVEGLDAGGSMADTEGGSIGKDDQRWTEIVATQPCEKDKEHEYTRENGRLTSASDQIFTHLKLVMEPDGGIKRFRAFGTRLL